ncbi:uncharacterized protein LOC122856381 [Aphidius gifuensis]|uniref:uncharacterized protein LOC122856381 n=1 Tax=Aphidius gifuensis TaxID=684658 RepID=UPI001CDC1B2A|nr:uncharacterized protein LOC122856381 [Aphidius gifuensis]
MSTISETYLDNFSSLRKAVTAAAWLRRFYQSFSARYIVDRSSWITSEERKIALLGLVINNQRLYFHEVIKQLSKGEALSRSSPLIKLTPFLDKDGALRVGGRLSRSLMTSDQKNPLILPRESKLTELILNECHVNTLHGGAQLMLATLRQQYWIVGGRVPVRSFINKCVVCVRHRAEAAQQLMGQLPASRVLKCKPFLHTGVDYAGPFELKT